MKKITFRIIALTLIFAHLFTICLRDISLAAGSPQLQKSSTKVTREELIGYDKKWSSGIAGKEIQRVRKSSLSAGGQESFSPEKAIKNFYLDPFSGAVNLSIPLFTPPGRKGAQPSLTLMYSSRNANGPFGWGWRMDIGYIERSTKEGVPNYNASDRLVYLLNGVNGDLVAIGGDEYRPKDGDPSFKFKLNGESWIVKDKQGNTYFFGRHRYTRATGVDSEWNTKTFRWYLDGIKDVNGNNILFGCAYWSNGIDPLPDQILYTYYRPDELNFDLSLRYGDPINKKGLFQVCFTAEGPRRDDCVWNNRSSAQTVEQQGYRSVNDITIKYYPLEGDGRQPVIIRKYSFEYEYSKRTGRLLLKKIKEIGPDGLEMPPIIFTYQENAEPSYEVRSIGNPLTGDNLWNIRVHDDAQFIYCWLSSNSDSKLWLNFLSGLAHGWGSIYTQSTGSDLGFNWNIVSNGGLTLTSPGWRGFYAWTYVYVQTERNLNLSCSGNARFAIFLNADYGHSYSGQSLILPLKSGYNLIELTGFSESSFNLNLTTDIAGNVDLMNSQQVIVPSLSGDFNGDGIDDMGTFFGSSGTVKIALSSRTIFLPKQTWIENFGVNQRLLLGDFNGDGKTDICAFDASSGNLRIALSDGTKFVDNGLWAFNFKPLESGESFETAAAGDFNGDGKSDMCIIRRKKSGNYQYQNALIGINKSGRFEQRQALNFGYINLCHNVPLICDYNGDGLADLWGYAWDEGRWGLNETNGHWVGSPDFRPEQFGVRKNPLVLDFNGDGRADIGYYERDIGKFKVRIATANKDILDPRYSVPVPVVETTELPFMFNLRDENVQIQTGDYNGDGLQDLAAYNALGNLEVALSKGDIPDLLSRVENGLGGTLDLKYKIYSKFSDPGGDLPFVLPVLSESIVSDCRENSYKTIYDYGGGSYDAQNKEFRGFAYAKTKDSEENFTETYFKQDDIYKGRLYKQEVKDRDGNLYSKIENTWQHTEPYPSVYFPYLAQTDNYIYDGDTSYKQTRTSFEYDAYGNTKKVISDGDIEFNGDEKTQITEYTYNTLDWILSCPKHTYLLDHNQNKVSEKWFYYDGHTNIDDPPAKGLLTKEEIWRYNPIDQSEQRLSTTYTYDEYGNLLSVTDPLARTTTTTYDPELHTYPVTTTNALGHSIKTTYDPKIGKLLIITDPNNQTTTNVYDSLGRLIKIIGPNDTQDYPGVIYEYDLTTKPSKVTKKVKANYASPPEYFTYYSFYDGLSRLIQTKSPAENDPQTNQSRQIISGIAQFDQRGQVKEKYLPYFVNSSTDYITSVYDTPHTTFTYDPLGRLIQTTNPDLTYSSITYSDWTRTVLDENGHYKTEYYDAYGRIVKIEEHNNSQTYTTIYEYDTMGNLVKLTDDKDNVTQVWYDSLGRKLKMDDPDMGVWNYEYDKVGNLLKQTDAKSQAIEFVYDALNRLTQKRYNAITQVTYQYDDLSKEYCIGRLAKIIDQSGSSEFFYDNLGREAKSIKTVSASGSYSVERTYDALNRLLTLKYPDGSVIKYEYNPQGIKRISNLSPTTYGIISNIDYSPTGQITKIQYGNGTETKYIYDPQTLRLKNLTTQSPQGKIQDLNYQFDNVGNIKNIADYVNTATQAFLYDDLNRLIQAQGSYGSFTYDYDSIGNMLYKEGVSLSYGKQGRLPHAVTQFGSTLLDYDANGNMIEKGSLELTYDTENRLSRAKDNAITQPHTITISLSPGWNFVSLPVIPQDPKIDSVLSAIAGKYDQVSRYNSSTKQFENYCGNPKYDQFSTFEYGEGYQIYITDSSDITLTLTGIIPDIPEPVSLRAGYNLIFSPKISEATVEAVLSSLKLGVDYAQVFCYNKSLKQFQEYSSAKKEFTTLQPGVAYYLYGLKDMSWTINNTSPTTSFLYDGDGGRVSKTVQLNNSINPITQVTYIGSLFEISEGTVHERGLSRTTTRHIFAGANRICAIESTGNQYFYHSDHLGSSNVITDVSGNQVQLTEFTPYGSTFKNEGSDVTKHKFTGKELDKTTGLYFYGARYYDPSLAHFITPDSIVQAPFDPQSLNRYSYCRNNPLIYTDPTGHSFWGAVGGFFSAIGSFIGGFFSAIGGFFSGFFGGAFGRGGSSGGSGGSSGGRSGGGGLSVLPSSSRQGSGPSSSEVSSSFISGAWNFGASVGNVLGSVFRTATFNLSGVVGDWASENWARATESRKTISPYASNFTGVEEVVAVSALPGLTEFVFGVIAILSVKATPAIGRAFDNLVVHFASGRRSSQKTPSSQQDLDRLNRQRTKSDNPLKPKQVPPDRDPTPAPIDPTNRRAPFSDPDGEYGPPWDDTMWRDALNN